MPAARHQPAEVHQLIDQHGCHHGRDADHRDGNPVGRAFGRGFGGQVRHARDGADTDRANRSARSR